MSGRLKASAMDRILRWHGEHVAEQIARAIEATAAGPGELCEDTYCPDFIRHQQSRQDAATARRIGAGTGGVPGAQPACSGVTAARRAGAR